MTIPAQLSKTIRTDKTHVGDKVEFKTVEPVPIREGVTMPIGTKLHGRVLGAASRQADKPSWLVVLVDNAEWKNHSLQLHAFIVSLINGNDQPSASSDPDLPRLLTNRHRYVPGPSTIRIGRMRDRLWPGRRTTPALWDRTIRS